MSTVLMRQPMSCVLVQISCHNLERIKDSRVFGPVDGTGAERGSKSRSLDSTVTPALPRRSSAGATSRVAARPARLPTLALSLASPAPPPAATAPGAG